MVTVTVIFITRGSDRSASLFQESGNNLTIFNVLLPYIHVSGFVSVYVTVLDNHINVGTWTNWR